MKLLTKTSLNFLTISLFIFMSGTIIFYYLLRQQVDQNINIELGKRKSSITSKLESVHSSAQLPPTQDEKITIVPIENNSRPAVSYSDTLIFDQDLKKYMAYRQMNFVAQVNNQDYLVTIYKSLSETDNLIVRILFLLTAIVVLLISSLLILNRHTSLKAWKVFYDTIEKINAYDINTNSSLLLEESDIKEFDDLNQVLNKMTDRINKNYLSLKEYTENAAHELQTPLAVINSKMELLLQSDNLSDKQLKAVADAFEATTKLSRYNKTLLLLAKIENRQFPEIKELNAASIIDEQLDVFEDLISARQIKVQSSIANNIVLKMNSQLAEILFSNLLKNAIRHNVKGGEIHIFSSDKSITVANSGNKNELDDTKLFQRFQKLGNSAESLGLGLAIVQKICEVSGFQVDYDFQDNKHQFSIRF